MESSKDDMMKMISLIYRKTQIYLNERTRKMGLSGSAATFIMITCEHGRMGQYQFCEMLNMSKGTVAKTLAKLEDQGYVTRIENKEDLRSIDVYPTKKALEAYPVLREIGREWVERMTDKMTEPEQREFFESLKKVSENICVYFGEK